MELSKVMILTPTSPVSTLGQRFCSPCSSWVPQPLAQNPAFMARFSECNAWGMWDAGYCAALHNHKDNSKESQSVINRYWSITISGLLIISSITKEEDDNQSTLDNNDLVIIHHWRIIRSTNMKNRSLGRLSIMFP
jgi:hypothetical protein